MTTEKDKARVCATCGKLENEFCSNSFHLSNDKTAEEIHDRYCAGVPYQLGLREASINAMKAYSVQQLKEYKEVIRELLPLAEAGLKDFLPESREEVKAEAIIERARKLIDQTDTK